jgi:2-polyprenyl-3-methyl-5-hydroxy-6-metoxy-1,4-benzoquinol methylase
VPPCEEIGEPSLLDIGCAYGPFLAAAKEEGFSPMGIDPAEDAVNYVQQKLAIPATQGFFPERTAQAKAFAHYSSEGQKSSATPCQISHPHSYAVHNSASHSSFLISHSFDIITLWFVIEHFTDCVTVLEEIKKLLKSGGILAFSTPSYSGISGRSSLRRFLSASPADHWTVWSPKIAKKALALAGFKVKKIVVTGHHSQRFPFIGKFAKSKKSPVYWLLLVISKIFGLGDSFEVYAKKI